MHILATGQGDFMIHIHGAASQHACLYVARYYTYVKWKWNLKHLLFSSEKKVILLGKCLRFEYNNIFCTFSTKPPLVFYCGYQAVNTYCGCLSWTLAEGTLWYKSIRLLTNTQFYMLQGATQKHKSTETWIISCVQLPFSNILQISSWYRCLCWPGMKSLKKSTFLNMIKASIVMWQSYTHIIHMLLNS